MGRHLGIISHAMCDDLDAFCRAVDGNIRESFAVDTQRGRRRRTSLATAVQEKVQAQAQAQEKARSVHPASGQPGEGEHAGGGDGLLAGCCKRCLAKLCNRRSKVWSRDAFEGRHGRVAGLESRPRMHHVG